MLHDVLSTKSNLAFMLQEKECELQASGKQSSEENEELKKKITKKNRRIKELNMLQKINNRLSSSLKDKMKKTNALQKESVASQCAQDLFDKETISLTW